MTLQKWYLRAYHYEKHNFWENLSWGPARVSYFFSAFGHYVVKFCLYKDGVPLMKVEFAELWLLDSQQKFVFIIPLFSM